MIKDQNGRKVSPRQKAAEFLLPRLGHFVGPEEAQVVEMTERELILVKTQMEKLHSKMHKVLIKALGEVESDEE